MTTATTPWSRRTRSSTCSLIKVVDNATANVGENVTFTITVANAGPSTATGVTVTDQLPSGFAYVNSNGAYNDGTGIWTIGTIASGASVSLDITATVLASGTYVNLAEVTTANEDDADSTPGNGADNNPGNGVGSEDPDGTQDPNDDDDGDDAVVTPNAVIDLSLIKVVDNATANVGENVTFTITVSNAGPSTATGVTVTDQLPSGFAFVNSNGAYNDGTGIWTIGSIASGASVSLDITATVLASGTYVNLAEVTTANEDDADSTPGNGADNNPGNGVGSEDPDGTQDPNDDDDGDDAVVTPNAVIDLSLIKVVDNATANVGENVTFTITVANAGPSTATGVTVTDQLPSGFAFVSSNGAYNDGTGIWTIGSIASGASVSLDITATVLASGTYVNLAEVTTANEDDADSTPGNGADNNPGNGVGSEDPDGTQDPNDDDDGDDAVVTPNAVIDLSLIKVVDNATANVGTDVTFTITVANAGPSTATGVTVTDQLPSGFAFVNSNGAYNDGTGIWTIGSIASGASVSLDITATVLASGTYVNLAEVTTANEDDADSTPGNGADNNPGNGVGSEDPDGTQDPNDDDDGDDAVVTPNAVIDLSLIKVVDNATANVGDERDLHDHGGERRT